MADCEKITKIILEINTTNAAFHENGALGFNNELNRIFRKIDEKHVHNNLNDGDAFLDSNGNTVAKIKVYTDGDGEFETFCDSEGKPVSKIRQPEFLTDYL